MFSATVSDRATVGCWKVRARPSRVRACTGAVVTGRPASSTSPAVAWVCPLITSNSVVLPAPFGPAMPSTSPAPTSNDTSATARSPP